MNANEDTTYRNSWDAGKAVFAEEYMAINIYISFKKSNLKDTMYFLPL